MIQVCFQLLRAGSQNIPFPNFLDFYIMKTSASTSRANPTTRRIHTVLFHVKIFLPSQGNPPAAWIGRRLNNRYTVDCITYSHDAFYKKAAGIHRQRQKEGAEHQAYNWAYSVN